MSRMISQVEKKRPVIDVVQIVLHTTLHFLERIGVAAIAVDLSPARNAGLDVVATEKRRNQLSEHLVLRRSRVDGARRATCCRPGH